jgi:TolB protein
MVAGPSAQAAFPGANGKIAFTSSRDGNAQIYTMNSDGGDVLRLTNDPGSGSSEPAWSSDGRMLAFRGSCQGRPWAVCVMNSDGSGERPVTDTGFVNDTGAPSWSPDGRRIVFQGERTPGDTDLYVVNVDGTGLVNLTNTPDGSGGFGEKTPAWSPDGSKIAFSKMVPPCCSNWEIFVMNADGTGTTRLTFDSDFDSAPDWSPDGKKIAYWSQPFGELRIMNANGSADTGFSPPALGFQPAWSPDGTRIVWSGVSNGNDIEVMNADGSDRQDITNTPTTSEGQADWQPIPNRPPDCSGVAASRPVLSTANHRLVPMALDGATDPDGDAVTITVDGVTQDEPVTGSGDHTSPDAADMGDGQLRVRAERNPHGDGRVYRIAFTASDGRGGSCSGTATVSVPRKHRKPAVDSAPPSYDSLVR